MQKTESKKDTGSFLKLLLRRKKSVFNSTMISYAAHFQWNESLSPLLHTFVDYTSDSKSPKSILKHLSLAHHF